MKRIRVCSICFICILLVSLIACNGRPTSTSVNGADRVTDEEETKQNEAASGTVGVAEEKKFQQESLDELTSENPIDQDKHFAPLFDPDRDIPESTHRELMAQYRKAWEEEYKNVIQWVLKKCKYEEDRNDILKFDSSVRECIEEDADSVLKTMLLETYEYKPGSGERVGGNSTGARVLYQEGKMYRGICLSLIETMSDYSEKYTFLKRDYSEISVG